MGIGDRNYEQWARESEKKLAMDQIIDQVKILEKEKLKWETHIERVLIDGPDSENKTEKYLNESITHNPTNNTFTEKINKIQEEIEKLKSAHEELKKSLL